MSTLPSANPVLSAFPFDPTHAFVRLGRVTHARVGLDRDYLRAAVGQEPRRDSRARADVGDDERVRYRQARRVPRRWPRADKTDERRRTRRRAIRIYRSGSRSCDSTTNGAARLTSTGLPETNELKRVRLAVVGHLLRSKRSVLPPIESVDLLHDFARTYPGRVGRAARPNVGAHVAVGRFEERIKVRRLIARCGGQTAFEERTAAHRFVARPKLQARHTLESEFARRCRAAAAA